MDFYIGTMGFSYKDWSGPFYPAELPARNYLTYYSRVFNAVEIDSTFYGTPPPTTIKRWSTLSPDGFKFCLKTPQVITHQLGLVGAIGLMVEFIATVQVLEEKLGAILIQFPPSFDASQAPVLDAFLQELPRGPRYAVEVRDASWYTARTSTAQLLEKHGVCWAATKYPGLPRQITMTADFIYIRWIGKHGSFHHHTHERLDRSEDLRAWWELIQANSDRAGVLFGFTNNDYAGFAPGSANLFKTIAGLPVEDANPPQQPRLL